MVWADLVMLLAVVQFIFLSVLVGRARGRYSVRAPATTGHDIFERYYRVQMNSLELLVMLIPAMLLASRYWSAIASAILGAIYLVGRFIYLRAYVSEPSSRSLGYGLSAGPILILVIGAAIGMVRSIAGI
jgi:glutathione S-transferase